ncbi:D-2-hydroxyacid dehydrogenase family protein [Humitalea rosea]|uniref:D-2-hydroxyacid dehydrogenase family protein n=1 Tax=Humitalea rosea TaxID=990373 RepID=UPI001B881054|nr:D-2-hydroxyacid dehydrogenase family protein [Humitalea rosea]
MVVLDDYADALRQVIGLSSLTGHAVTIFRDTARTADRMVERLADAEAVLLIQQRSRLPRAVIERLPKLRLVSQTGRNTGHIDLDACTEHGIVVSARGTGQSSATAELTWGLILAALRDIPREAQRLRDGLWLDSIGTTISGKTLGVYGFGAIGSLVASIGKAFGMRVVCWGRESANQRAREAGFAVAEDRDALFATADVLSLHLALNDETRGIVSAVDLARMKPDALLVNTGRAGLIAPGVLAAALAAGRPGRAAVDVFDDEPVLGAADPLIGMANALCTPHLGYSVREMYGPLLTNATDQIKAFAAGRPIDVVNPAVLTR